MSDSELTESGCCALLMWDLGGLNIAVPKKRGKGYLKQPYGHYAVRALDEISFSESVDMCGLDGYLNLEYGYVNYDDRAAIIDRLMPRLAAHYGFTAWKEDAPAFWTVMDGFLHKGGDERPGKRNGGKENARS